MNTLANPAWIAHLVAHLSSWSIHFGSTLITDSFRLRPYIGEMADPNLDNYSQWWLTHFLCGPHYWGEIFFDHLLWSIFREHRKWSKRWQPISTTVHCCPTHCHHTHDGSWWIQSYTLPSYTLPSYTQHTMAVYHHRHFRNTHFRHTHIGYYH